jgi:hypothetical protein
VHYASDLDDDGKIYSNFSMFSEISFFKIIKPKSVSLEKICTDPRYILDLILQNKRINRYVWFDDYRILSFGDPVSTGFFKDSLGRTWITAFWNIGYEYSDLIMYILPMPDGPVIITTKQNTASIKEYEWDLQKTCDHLFVVYGASFEDWGRYFALDKYIPDFLKDMNFKWNGAEQAFSFNCGGLSINADKRVFDWSNQSELLLAPSWYKQNNKLEFGVRKVTLRVDKRGKENIIFHRNIKPDPKLGSNVIENWNDLAMEKFPFNDKPVVSSRDNSGFMGYIIKAKQPDPDVCFSLYLGMDNPQSEENISRRFNAFKNGVSIER